MNCLTGDSQELRIVLLGVCGAGKSPIGNIILGRETFKESRTRKSEIQRGSVKDRNISIIDTPGFFNTKLTDEELQNEMIKSLYLAYPCPHVFLLIINLESFRDDERKLLEQIQENFGAQALNFTLVLFTGREKISNKEWMDLKFSSKFQELMSQCRDKYHVINSKRAIDPTQITELLEKIDELIKQNNHQHYDNDSSLKSYLVKTRKKKKNHEKVKDYRKNAQEKEIKKEQLKITETCKMQVVKEKSTTNVVNEKFYYS
ncbi:GTPase IMAP family member 4-like [Onychostoma macrolepis]|uniref:GTPase IMAP family member 4-like n=1 Tax=Onychostoma macrolepis TaxID=369639 RepID=UPI00272A5135|nr:GTPase IMAP family member 4-like [Onychostoma macrolepis]